MEAVQQRYRAIAIGGAAVAVLTTVVRGAIEWRTRTNVIQSAGSVSHTLQVQNEFGRLLQSVTDAETSQRGFLLTGFAVYFDRHVQAKSDAWNALRRVRDLTSGNPAQQRRLQRVESLIEGRFAVLDEAAGLAQRNDRDAAFAVVAAMRGQRLMDEIRREVAGGTADQERLLADQTRAFDAVIERRAYWMWGFVAFNALLLAALLTLAVRLRRQELMVTLCLASKTIRDDGTWISFEEYLRRKFGVNVSLGLSPAEADRLSTDIETMRVTDRH